MTWVIGGSTVFGYGIVLSDICVSSSTGKRWNMLQKAFPLGKFIAGGLAGDVGTGFTMLRSLQQYLNDPPVPPGECWEPEHVSHTWSVEARRLYGDIAAHETIGDVHLLTVGVSPRPDALGGAVPVVTVFRSPDFAPEMTVGGNVAVSIGSGSQVEAYRKALEHLFQYESPLLQGEIGAPGGFGKAVANMIHHEAALNPVDGVSECFHFLRIKLGSIETWTPNGMPDVAKNWPELLQKIQSSNPGALTAHLGN